MSVACLLKRVFILLYTGEFVKSQQAYERMLELALSQSNKSLEAKACANLGIIHYQVPDQFTRFLELATPINTLPFVDFNILSTQLHDYETALKLQARNLELSVEFRDVGAQGRAHGNIGNSYSAMGMYDQVTILEFLFYDLLSLSGVKPFCSSFAKLSTVI